MPARIGRLSAGMGCRHPVTIRKASVIMGSIRRVWALQHQTGAQHSAVEWLGWLFATLLLQHPCQSQQAASGVWRVMLASCEVTQGVGGTRTTCPTVFRGISARNRRAGFRCWSRLSAHVWLPCWDGRPPTPFSWCWASASKSGGSHLVLPCPCSAPLPLPANLHQHAWLLCRQHMHTFWKWWLAGQRCRC